MHHSGMIFGADHIKIGVFFRAGRIFWLEAVTQYHSSNFNPQLSIGNNVSCGDGCHIAAAYSVIIGNNVLMGSKVHITDHLHGKYKEYSQSNPSEPPLMRDLSGYQVKIGDNVFIGDGVVVLPGADVGDGVVIGANSVVTGALPPKTVCIGSPAIPVKFFDEVSRQWQ